MKIITKMHEVLNNVKGFEASYSTKNVEVHFIMTVYVVTHGEYSEYGIEKIFSNPAAAEEYKKWHNLSNDIEEYELEDVAFKPIDEQKKAMSIRVRGAVHPEAVVDLQYNIYPSVVYETTPRKCAGIAKSMFADGATGKMVSEAIHNEVDKEY